jgi:hypothetical protein
MANASEARQVVFSLFQDLDGFSLDDYQPFADVQPGLDRIVQTGCQNPRGRGLRTHSREYNEFRLHNPLGERAPSKVAGPSGPDATEQSNGQKQTVWREQFSAAARGRIPY